MAFRSVGDRRPPDAGWHAAQRLAGRRHLRLQDRGWQTTTTGPPGKRGATPDGKPHVIDGTSAARIADSWNLWRADLSALQLLGANVYRMGIEWSRLEPTEGAWDEAAAARYREMFAALRAAHISPMVTLYHFTLPTWVAARGGWEWDGAPAALAAFAGRAAAAFGDLVDLWCTINEAQRAGGEVVPGLQWPPGVRRSRGGRRWCWLALMRAHGLATEALRAHDRADADGDGFATRIGIAQNLRIFDPYSSNPIDGLVAGAANGFYDEAFLDAVTLGRVRVVLPQVIDIDEPFPALAGSFDYLGIIYYARPGRGRAARSKRLHAGRRGRSPAQRPRVGGLPGGALPPAPPLCAPRLAAHRHGRTTSPTDATPCAPTSCGRTSTRSTGRAPGRRRRPGATSAGR